MLGPEPLTCQAPARTALLAEWHRSTAGERSALSRWQKEEGGHWTWEPSGALLRGSQTEWAALSWLESIPPRLSELQNFVVEITVSGKANAAGISFGPFKDFLTPLERGGKRRLQLEVDGAAGTWTFRVDGRLMTRQWWDSAVRSAGDIVSGILTLKARLAEDVLFEELSIERFVSSCRISVIMTCFRFQQRLRVSLRNWCHQTLPPGAFEILIINPQSPDGTRELVAATARSFPHIRVREIAAGAEIARNKGAMINRGVRASRGEWLWFTDADCLFPPDCLKLVLDRIDGDTGKLFYGQRRYLPDLYTDALISGRLDGLADFGELVGAANGRPSENAPWGYTQIVSRSIFERAPYREDINHFAYSDDVFVQECRRRQILPEQIPGLFCLHLHHPFAWYGTDAYL